MKRRPLYLDLCTSELWDGVRCTLPAGHQGSHQRPATDTTCAISWESSSFPPPLPERRELSRLKLALR